MNKKFFILIISMLLWVSMGAIAQQPGKSILPIDTLNNKKAIRLINSLILGDLSDPLVHHISVLGNPDCGHCLEIEKLLQEKNISFDLYDLRDNNLLLRVHDLIVKQENTPKVAYGYPIILFEGMARYNIKDSKVFVEELSQKVK